MPHNFVFHNFSVMHGIWNILPCFLFGPLEMNWQISVTNYKISLLHSWDVWDRLVNWTLDWQHNCKGDGKEMFYSRRAPGIAKEESFLHLRFRESSALEISCSCTWQGDHFIAQMLAGKKHQRYKRQSDVRSLLTCHEDYGLCCHFSLWKIPSEGGLLQTPLGKL